jgi:hypothetical protein
LDTSVKLQFNGLILRQGGVSNGTLPRYLTGILQKNTPLKKREISHCGRKTRLLCLYPCLNSEGAKFHWGLNITTGCFLAAVVFLGTNRNFLFR